ncbi:MAG TPA: hypothetical protein VFT22_29425 [Kofleriaceae bacterium]|nr:hypothetical protein [Kofleriaceae bacterium]
MRSIAVVALLCSSAAAEPARTAVDKLVRTAVATVGASLLADGAVIDVYGIDESADLVAVGALRSHGAGGKITRAREGRGAGRRDARLGPPVVGTGDNRRRVAEARRRVGRLKLVPDRIHASLFGDGKLAFVTATMYLPRKTGPGAVRMSVAIVATRTATGWRWVSLQFSA